MDTKPKTKKDDDLRIRRTYKYLAEALLSLLGEKPFEQITVKDICERAMVHRTTFYKHFEDKYHLFTFLFQDIQNNFEETTLSNKNFDNPRQYYLDILRAFLMHFNTNKKIYTQIYSNNTANSATKMLHELTLYDVQSKITAYQQEGGVLPFPIPVPVVAEFHVGAIISLASWWIVNDMPYSEEELVGFIDKMIF